MPDHPVVGTVAPTGPLTTREQHPPGPLGFMLRAEGNAPLTRAVKDFVLRRTAERFTLAAWLSLYRIGGVDVQPSGSDRRIHALS